jgi:hypothetical protein
MYLCSSPEVPREILVFIIQRIITSQLLQPLHFIFTSRNSQYSGPLQLSNLCNNGSSRTSCTGDNYKITLVDLSNIKKAEISRQTRYAYLLISKMILRTNRSM